MTLYPDSDFPFTFYFQGIAMPKWSNCWHFQPVDGGDVEWYVDQVHTRIDHVGVIESEESAVFTIAAQQVLLQSIDHKEKFTPHVDFSEKDREAVYQGLLAGLRQMIALAEAEEVVFWTGGYESDRATLVDAVRRFRLGDQHPDYFQPRHRIRRREERLFQLNYQRKELRRRLATIGSDKVLKRFIYELKDRI